MNGFVDQKSKLVNRWKSSIPKLVVYDWMKKKRLIVSENLADASEY